MFQLYLGKKSRHIPLINSGILEATLTTEINRPLVLELLIDLAYYEDHNSNIIDYFIKYDSSFYLEILGLRGHRFRKKHNKHKSHVLISVDNNEYITPQGTENLNSGFSYGQYAFFTKNGYGLYIIDDLASDDGLIEYHFYDRINNSQELVQRLRQEELSIVGQTLSNNILKLTLFSELEFVNNSVYPFVWGQTYNSTKQDLINLIFGTTGTNSNLQNKNITYTFDNRLKLDHVDEILEREIIQDKGYNIDTDSLIFNTYTPTDFNPLHRATSQFTHNRNNPIIISLKENYPSISIEMMNYNNYIVEGELIKLDYQTKTKNYQGNFVVKGMTYDLLHRYNSKSTSATLLSQVRNIRNNYLEKNLDLLNKKYI